VWTGRLESREFLPQKICEIGKRVKIRETATHRDQSSFTAQEETHPPTTLEILYMNKRGSNFNRKVQI